MKSLVSLRETRAAKVEALRMLVSKAEAEPRDMSEAEQSAFDTAFDAGKAEVEALDKDIRRAEFLAEAERRGPAQPLDGEMARDLGRYSVARALRGQLNGRLDGVEAAFHEELSRGREVRGVMIPTSVLLERRAITTTTPVDGPGGNLVATNLGPMIDRLRPALLVQAMGATVVNGLVGNIEYPKLTEGPTAHWVGEHVNTTRSDAKFGKVPMGPKTVSGEMELSRRMLLQASVAIEDVLRRDLGFVLAQALDRAAIKGGGANEPDGILEHPDVVEVPNTFTGNALDSDVAADLIAALELDDVTGTGAFLTHPSIMQAARKLKDGDGRVIPLAEIFHGKPVQATNNMPPASDSTGAGYPLIFGHWSDLIIGYWSGVDILANPYHHDVASKGGLLIHAFLDADVALRHGEAFAWSEIG